MVVVVLSSSNSNQQHLACDNPIRFELCLLISIIRDYYCFSNAVALPIRLEGWLATQATIILSRPVNNKAFSRCLDIKNVLSSVSLPLIEVICFYPFLFLPRR